jgi:hypothetical protein
MKKEILARFAKLEGYNHERDGIKIPEPPKEEIFHKVVLYPNDMKRIKEIASIEGADPDNLSDVDIWGIVSDSLIKNFVDLRMKKQNSEKLAGRT